MMKKLGAFILVISLLLTLLVGCDRDYDEDEVKSAATELLEKSILVNEIFYGEGIPYNKSSYLTNGIYSPAKASYLSSIGVSSTEDIKSLAREVYTEGLCEIIFETKFSSIKDSEGNIKVYRRYYDYTSDGVSYIMANTEKNAVIYDNDVEYLYETLTVLGADGEYINIEVDVLLTNPVGQKRTATVELKLLEEDNGFRLDTWSYVKF